MIQIGHKIKKIVILVLVGDPFKPEVIRASANLFEKRTRNRMGKKNYQNQIYNFKLVENVLKTSFLAPCDLLLVRIDLESTISIIIFIQ